MKHYILILLTLFVIPLFGQQKITLNECYELAEKNYPLAKQTNLLQQKATHEIDALNKAKLPTINLNAQATYQSDVAQVPFSVPNMSIDTLNNDQYKATLDVNQLLYNGGIINATTKLKNAQTRTQQQQVAVT